MDFLVFTASFLLTILNWVGNVAFNACCTLNAWLCAILLFVPILPILHLLLHVADAARTNEQVERPQIREPGGKSGGQIVHCLSVVFSGVFMVLLMMSANLLFMIMFTFLFSHIVYSPLCVCGEEGSSFDGHGSQVERSVSLGCCCWCCCCWWWWW